MSGKVVQLKHIGTVKFLQNSRSKNIKISVKPDKSVLVSFPFYVSGSEVMKFLNKNEGWIIQQQNKFELVKPRIDEGTQIKTKLHTVIIETGEANKTLVDDLKIRIQVPDLQSQSGQQYIEKVMVSIYKFEAEKILPERILGLAAKHQLSFNRLTIRNNKRNWGSCSSKNNISLNLQMMRLPDELIDYILLHELVHTQVKNHGPKFWAKLDELTGFKARELAHQVRKYSTYTLS